MIAVTWSGLQTRENDMKKTSYLLLIIFLILATGCNKVQSDTKGDSSVNIEFKKGTYYDKNWEEETGTYQQDVIPDKDTAVKIATQIFNGMEKNSDMEKYVPQSVFYDEIDGIWIVSFWEKKEDSEMLTVGDDCSIALKRKNGQVLRIWFGE